MLDTTREWAILITAVCSAILGVSGVIGGTWMLWGRPMKKWFEDREYVNNERLRNIERQVSINGSRTLLPESQRHLLLADLVVTHIAQTAPMIEQFVREHNASSSVGTVMQGSDVANDH